MEFSSVENMEINLFVIIEICSKLLSSRADKHVFHEESMIRSTANNSNLKSVFWVPSSITINDV